MQFKGLPFVSEEDLKLGGEIEKGELPASINYINADLEN